MVLGPTLVAGVIFGLPALPSGVPWTQPTNTMSAEMAQITDRIGFSDEGRAIFSDTHPQLLDSTEFQDACVTEDGTDVGAEAGQPATVGCYVGNGAGFGQISIFRPGDDRLADQAVVTAAHEFLHAAYALLTPDERAFLDPLLETRWSLVPLDDPIQARLASSVGTTSESRATEQFAYLGSEIADVGDPALEAYYAPYFRDRQALVAINSAHLAMWQGLVDDHQAKADALLAHEQSNADAGAQLQADREQRDADVEVHNRQVAEYNALPPADQARLFVMDPDGDVGDEAWGSYLARNSDELAARQADIAARQAQLDASGTDAQAERAAIEVIEADLQALNAAGVPADR